MADATRTLFEFAQPPSAAAPQAGQASQASEAKADLAATVLDPSRPSHPEAPDLKADLATTVLDPSHPDAAPVAPPPSDLVPTIGRDVRDVTVEMNLAETMPRSETMELPTASPLASPAAGAARPPAARTMIGVAAPPDLLKLLRPAAPGPATAAASTQLLASTASASTFEAPATAPTAAGRAAIVAKTILGVAAPKLAPVAPGAPGAGQAPVTPSAGKPPAAPGKAIGTILGVAMPGIAPLRPGVDKTAFLPQQPPQAQRVALPAPPLEPIVPRPAPLVDEPLPDAPKRASRSGVPLAAVAGGLAGLVLVAGVVVALVWKGAPPIVARPTLDAQGREALHLTCDACADGTGVNLSGTKTTFKNKEADLLLPSPLKIGQNPFSLQIARPGLGRDETVKVTVPVNFRIRADMSGVNAKPPVITVRVEAAAGTAVEVDGKPIALDGAGAEVGRGEYVVDISAETQGTSTETKRIEKKIPFSVTQTGAGAEKSGGKTDEPVKGTLPAALGVTPLHLDAPGMHAVTDQKTFVVAGQTLAGGAVTINGQPAPVEPSGVFARTLDAPSTGEVAVDVVATMPQLAARTAHFAVRRVESLDAEARAAEALASTLLTYDGARDIAAHVGQGIVIEGEIIETRQVGHQTILVVTDRRGCAAKADPNQCLARVLSGAHDTRKKGEIVRVFGHITRAVQAQNGRAVPEIEADFLAKPHGR
jgi:hypothetical protein